MKRDSFERDSLVRDSPSRDSLLRDSLMRDSQMRDSPSRDSKYRDSSKRDSRSCFGGLFLALQDINYYVIAAFGASKKLFINNFYQTIVGIFMMIAGGWLEV